MKEMHGSSNFYKENQRNEWLFRHFGEENEMRTA